MTTPKDDHWVATKRALRYVKGTPDYGLLYTRRHDPRLSGFTDSDWAGSVDDRKSTSGYVFNLGSGAVTRTSKKQQVVPLSSTEAEYRGAVKGVLKLVKNPVFHERTKHVETHCHFIRKLVEDGSVQLQYVPTAD
ncbi:secreted RxLR effector protein 161-like [Cryptomeria japonica]|uniref:secreted RxLR effector protein 161-like n=1 Tax=Cryptomeria japonica TaxID=3369 RepID=UPI0027DA0502|nr:secreted RxLR effector protein 161-like [Cryptomeria japonica]